MAVYHDENRLNELNELSVNSLGVLDKDGGFTGNYTSRILVIGLGGMGLKTTLKLKKELNDRLGTITPGFIRVLSLDTDVQDRAKAIKSGLMTEGEIPQLNNSAVGQSLAAKEEFRPKPIGTIIPKGFSQTLNGAGANQVRLAGRLTVMDINLFRTIYTSIKEAITYLKDFTTTTLDVHVAAGIGGGSGSGLVIDVPYIVRAVVRDLGIPESKLRIFGHIYLPNSYTGIANYESAYRNGYAALKEIDYYMTLADTGETFDALYPDPVGEFSSQSPIFTQCTLVGGRICTGIVFNNPQEKAISVCVENLVNQCTSVKGTIGNGQTGNIADFFTAESFHVNTDQALSVVKADPNIRFPAYGNYKYNLIGASSIKFPTEAIVEQLVGEMGRRSNEMLKANVKNLKQADVDSFEAGLIRPGDIIENWGKRLAANIDNIHSDTNIKWTKSSILSNEHTIPLDEEVTKAITAFDADGASVEAIVAEANRRAEAIFSDPAKGPYFLERLLMTNSRAGGNVQGYYEKLHCYADAAVNLKNRYETSYAEFDRQKQQLAQTMQEFGKFNRNVDKFKELLKDLFVTKFKIRLCNSLINEYYVDINQNRGVSFRIKNSLDRDFLSFVDIFAYINEILVRNADAARAKLSDTAQNDPTSIFSLTGPEFTALQSAVMNTVATKMRRLGDNAPAQFAAAFTGAMMSNKAAWQLSEKCLVGESRAANEFRKFIKNYPPFADVVNRKMIDYFNEAYEGQPDSFKDSVIRKLIETINYNSAPMCNVWQQPHFDFIHVDKLCYRYLVLPDGFNSESDTSGWGGKFGRVFGMGDAGKNIYWSPDQNAIYSYTLYAKMPIWIHEDLTKYEDQYYKLNIPGAHINENPNLVPPLKDYPSLMIPSQWYRTRIGGIEYSNDNEIKIFDRVRTAVKYAKKFGIINQTEGGAWQVDFIQDKPNVKDGRSRVTIDVFVRKYVEDPTNRDEKGKLMIDKGCNLWKKIKASFDCAAKDIIGSDGTMAFDEETVVNLIRKQMKLFTALEAEIEFFKEYFLNPVSKAGGSEERTETCRNIAKYMLFDLVFCERAMWKYKLGDTSYGIVSTFDVQDGNASWKVDYMEMAVCDVIGNVENFEAHKALLDERVKNIQRSIAMGDAAGNAAYDNVKASYDKLKGRCETILSEIETRRLNGNELTAQEIERRDFYTVFLKSATDLVKLFAF